MFNEEATIEKINDDLRKAKYPTIQEWEIDGRGPYYHARVFGRNGNRKKTYVGLGYVKYNPNDRTKCCHNLGGEPCQKRGRDRIHHDSSLPGYHEFKTVPQSHGMGRKLALSRAVTDLIEQYKSNK